MNFTFISSAQSIRMSLWLLTLAFTLSAAPGSAQTKGGSAGAKAFQVYFNPVGLAVGMVDVGAEFATVGGFTIGPTFMSLNYKNNAVFYEATYKSFGVGLRAAYQFNGNAISRGWIVSALALYLPKYSVTARSSGSGGSEYSSETSEYIADVVGGYRWVWGFFTLKLAAGARYNSLSKERILKDSSGNSLTIENKNAGVAPAGELQLGFAF